MAIALHGDPSLDKTLVTLKSMMKAFRESGEGVLLELGSLTAKVIEARVAVPDNLQEVVTEFKVVFEEPCGLPPAPEAGSYYYAATWDFFGKCETLLLSPPPEK